MIGYRVKARHQLLHSIVKSIIPRSFNRELGESREPPVKVWRNVPSGDLTLKEPVYKILEHVKNEPYFCWLGKMGGDLERRN